MKGRKTYRLLTTALVLILMISCSKEEGVKIEEALEPQAVQGYSEPIPGQYIVVYKEPGKMKGDHQQNRQAVQHKTRNLFSRHAIAGAEVLQVYSAALSGITAKLTKDQVVELRNSTEIAYIEQDHIVTLAPPCGTPKGGPCNDVPDNGGETGGEEVPYGIARVNGGVNYSGHLAWVIDTGIDLDHPDLNVEANLGFNAFSSSEDGQTLDDGNGHGSHVAGTIAAIGGNGIGVVGVAAGATVVPVKVLDSNGSGTYSGVIAGVNWVAEKGKIGDVANLSLGGPTSQALDDAVIAASNNVIFVIAAGNDRHDANRYSPARVNGDNIYTISAMDSSDKFASFSNYGNPPIDYAAPGVSIKSTWKNGGYNTISGTSMAAPHAAGVLLLGSPSTDGNVIKDRDRTPDAIIVNQVQ